MIVKNVLSNKHFGYRLKCSIQSTGKLGFTEQTIKAMGIDRDTAFLFYPDSNKEDLYIVKVSKDNEDAFPVRVSGKYFYLNTKTLFDTMEYPYKDKYVWFEIKHEQKLDEEMGGNTYLLKVRKEERSEAQEPEIEVNDEDGDEC